MREKGALGNRLRNEAARKSGMLESCNRLEPVTHFLTGACLGRAGLNRKTALATLTLTLAAEAPDLDVIAGMVRGPTFGFAHHRGFTHSFVGIVLDAAVVLGFVYLIWRIRGRKVNDPKIPPRWSLLFLYACLAGLSHILLDFTNNYGVRPFWPFSEKWYSWDIVFIFEPVMFGFLLLGLIVPSLFALIDKEIGARRAPRGRVAATLALVGVVLLWGLRDYEHRRAVSALEAREYNGADPVRVSAYPKWIDPFHWYGVVETPAFFALAPVDSLAPEVDPEGSLEIRYKPAETPVTLAAKNSYAGRVFLDWAKYPITETEPLQPPRQGFMVLFQDLRFAGISIAGRRPSRRALTRAVEIDKNLHVVGDVYETKKGQVVVPEPN